MKMMSRFAFYIFFIIFQICIGTLLEAHFEAHFFDVGQGSCTLLKFTSGPPLLYDAGSSWHADTTSEGKESFKTTQRSSIVNKINGALPPKNKPVRLNVVISHGDADHHNWVVKILEQLPELKGKVRFLLGGLRADYTDEKFKKFINKFKVKDKKAYVEDYENLDEIKDQPFECKEALCTVLAAEKGGRKREKNYRSIVLKVTSMIDEDFSVMLTGDATGDTTRGILGSLPHERLMTTVLQASHHGATSHESNNTPWVGVTQPKYVIISAGERVDYGHPNHQSILNFLGSPRLSLLDPHFLQYRPLPTFDDAEFDCADDEYMFSYRTTKFATALSDRAIFNTINQGNIIVKPGRLEFSRRPVGAGAAALSSIVELMVHFLTAEQRLLSQTVWFRLPSVNLTELKTLDSLGGASKLSVCDLSQGTPAEDCDGSKAINFINALVIDERNIKIKLPRGWHEMPGISTALLTRNFKQRDDHFMYVATSARMELSGTEDAASLDTPRELSRAGSASTSQLARRSSRLTLGE